MAGHDIKLIGLHRKFHLDARDGAYERALTIAASFWRGKNVGAHGKDALDTNVYILWYSLYLALIVLTLLQY